MDPIKQIDVHKVKEMEGNASATIVDIRDPASYQTGHIPNAIHLGDNTIQQFILDTDKKNHWWFIVIMVFQVREPRRILLSRGSKQFQAW